MHFGAHVPNDDIINIDKIKKLLQISLFWWNFILFSLKLAMAPFVLNQNIYTYDVTNKYTQHIKIFRFNTDGATTVRAKNWVK